MSPKARDLAWILGGAATSLATATLIAFLTPPESAWCLLGLPLVIFCGARGLYLQDRRHVAEVHAAMPPAPTGDDADG